ncbi:MAG: hypothetical protein ABI442_17195 [Gemmatimonadaceae bacterium]
MIDHDTSPEDSFATLVRGAAPTAFEPGFTDRVLARLRAEREHPFSLVLERQFRRIVPLLAAASLLFAAYNWWSSRDTASSVIDAALNLPRVSMASAYTASSLLETATTTEPEMP